MKITLVLLVLLITVGCRPSLEPPEVVGKTPDGRTITRQKLVNADGYYDHWIYYVEGDEGKTVNSLSGGKYKHVEVKYNAPPLYPAAQP